MFYRELDFSVTFDVTKNKFSSSGHTVEKPSFIQLVPGLNDVDSDTKQMEFYGLLSPAGLFTY